jgi:hypothetical protein
MAPPGSANVPVTIGGITVGVAIIACIAAYSARETYRLKLDDLGNPNATPVPKDEYDRIRKLGEATAASATRLAAG